MSDEADRLQEALNTCRELRLYDAAEIRRLRAALERIADAAAIMAARGFAQEALINQKKPDC
jgi:hypothetical protein